MRFSHDGSSAPLDNLVTDVDSLIRFCARWLAVRSVFCGPRPPCPSKLIAALGRTLRPRYWREPQRCFHPEILCIRAPLRAG